MTLTVAEWRWGCGWWCCSDCSSFLLCFSLLPPPLAFRLFYCSSSFFPFSLLHLKQFLFKLSCSFPVFKSFPVFPPFSVLRSFPFPFLFLSSLSSAFSSVSRFSFFIYVPLCFPSHNITLSFLSSYLFPSSLFSLILPLFVLVFFFFFPPPFSALFCRYL